jgi:hypothetical protein
MSPRTLRRFAVSLAASLAAALPACASTTDLAPVPRAHDDAGAASDVALVDDAGAPPIDRDAAVSDDAGTQIPSDGGAIDAGAIDAPADVATIVDASPSGAFAHPGVLVNGAQLDFVKAKIAAGAEPWTSALAKAKSSPSASLSLAPGAIATVECGPYSNPDVGCSAEKDAAIAAYTDALIWALTGDAAYAAKSASILDAWSSTITAHTNSNAPLQSAWVASVFPRAGEILRATYPTWPAANVARFGKMLHDVYLPEVIHGAKENGNWELSMADATIAIGVFLDDRQTFDAGVALWRRRVPAYIYLSKDGPLPNPPPIGGGTTTSALETFWYGETKFVDGVAQETCRDLGHTQLGFAAMINAAETARIQGVDLYSEQKDRIVAGLEFNAQYLVGAAVPSWLCGGTLTSPTATFMWEIAYNEYAGRLGMSLPQTQAVIGKVRPTATNHHMVFETLTHAEVGSVGLP